jgi:transcriptional regulator with XRE-family HTH domain
MDLLAECRAQGLDVATIARESGRSQRSVYRYLRGERRPPYGFVQTVRHLTGERITANDFYDLHGAKVTTPNEAEEERV